MAPRKGQLAGSRHPNFKHGEYVGGRPSREMAAWKAMHVRCYDPEYNEFHRYGGRGIRVCRQWHGPEGFARFLACVGRCPPGHSLDRIKTSKNYMPGNVQWSTSKTQNRNRENNRLVRFQGREQSLAAWCEELGLLYPRTFYRISIGLTPAEAFDTAQRRRGCKPRKG